MRHFLVIAVMIATGAWAHVSVAAPDQSRAHLPRVPRIKLLRSNPHRFTAIRLQGTNPYDAPDDEFLCSSQARKPRVRPFQPDLDDDEQLGDYVKTRLLIARIRALEKYREMQG